jgi:NAD(P)-dependent dehydrogenase (short-subunit alcohol dehydrogenase family)
MELGTLAAKHYPADAGEPQALTNAIENAILDSGPPDLLVYNAFKFAFGKPSGIDPQVLTNDFSVNVSGALTSSRAVLPLMLKRKSGTILFTGGGWAIHPSVDYASVSIGKAGLRSLALTLAEEFRGTGVRVGTVTIMGTVKPGTPFDPEKIGETFLNLYKTSSQSFTPEVQFTGS